MEKTKQVGEQRKAWIEPEIKTLEIDETESLNGRGADGGPYNPTSQRS